jgi:hypothetical protein
MTTFNETTSVVNVYSDISPRSSNAMITGVTLTCCVLFIPCIIVFIIHCMGWDLKYITPVNTIAEPVFTEPETPYIIDIDIVYLKHDDIPEPTQSEVDAFPVYC